MTEDDYGNPIPQTEIATVEAILIQDLRRDPQALPGLDQDQQLMKGYLVKPTALPLGVRAGAIAQCALTESPGVIAEGKFEIVRAIQNPYIMAAGVPFLTRIGGVFRPAR